jgi:hypothetical protein
MNMYRRITLTCECGRQAARVHEIGLTADRQLVIHWRCSHCRKYVYVVKPLADYWRECPSHHVVSEHKAARIAEDMCFLRRLGIVPPEDEEKLL